ncbi:MAG: hypothetical protein WC294_10525 [Methanoregula sp.]|jgi:hypothetical protein
MSAPASPHTDSIKTKKNRVYQPARFDAYPSCLILLAVRVKKFRGVVIIKKGFPIY